MTQDIALGPDRPATRKPTDEIDCVTPAMIAAGRDAIESRWTEFVGVSGFRLWDEVMREVWGAMKAKSG